jgi:hypothetical protein
VLARAEAALEDDAAVPSLMRDDEPDTEPGSDVEAGPQAATDVEVEVAAPDLEVEPEAESAPVDEPAAGSEAESAQEGNDVPGPSGPSAPPPKRERRHGQVRKRRRS